MAKHDAENECSENTRLWQARSEAVMHLRCSLLGLGPELGGDWPFFIWNRQRSTYVLVRGFTNRIWNGVTSSAVGRIVSGVVKRGPSASGVHRKNRKDGATRELPVRLELESLASVGVTSCEAPSGVGRNSSTFNHETKPRIFTATGCLDLLTIPEMVEDLHSELAH